MIVGELDTPDFQQISATLERLIPNARPVVVPRVGHMVNLEAPEVFNELLITFMTGAGCSSRPS